MEKRGIKDTGGLMVTKIVAEERREEADLKEKAHHRDPNLHPQNVGQE